MRTRLLIAASVIAAVIVVSGCYLNDPQSSSAARLSLASPFAPQAAPDSMPGPNPHPPHQPKQSLTVQFAGADSGVAGQSATTRWQFGNSGHQSLTVAWSLTDGHHWPGFPKQGTVALAPLGTQLLQIPVAVPDTAQVGPNPLHMTATPSRGSPATADGAIQVIQ